MLKGCNILDHQIMRIKGSSLHGFYDVCRTCIHIPPIKNQKKKKWNKICSFICVMGLSAVFILPMKGQQYYVFSSVQYFFYSVLTHRFMCIFPYCILQMNYEHYNRGKTLRNFIFFFLLQRIFSFYFISHLHVEH